jgi:hypothetical protein
MVAPAPTANASSRSATTKSGMSRLSLCRTWYPVMAPASDPSPPKTAPSTIGFFTVPYIAAPQIAPDTIRDARGAASRRLRVKGNLSTTRSLIANPAILFEVLAETILANDECPGRIRPRLRAEAITASAVVGRNPATAPMPSANAQACWCFIFVSPSQYNSVRTGPGNMNHQELRSLLNIVYGISRLLQSLRFHLGSRWLTIAY